MWKGLDMNYEKDIYKFCWTIFPPPQLNLLLVIRTFTLWDGNVLHQRIPVAHIRVGNGSASCSFIHHFTSDKPQHRQHADSIYTQLDDDDGSNGGLAEAGHNGFPMGHNGDWGSLTCPGPKRLITRWKLTKWGREDPNEGDKAPHSLHKRNRNEYKDFKWLR